MGLEPCLACRSLIGSCWAHPTGCRPGPSTARLVLQAGPGPFPAVSGRAHVGPNSIGLVPAHLTQANFFGISCPSLCLLLWVLLSSSATSPRSFSASGFTSSLAEVSFLGHVCPWLLPDSSTEDPSFNAPHLCRRQGNVVVFEETQWSGLAFRTVQLSCPEALLPCLWPTYPSGSSPT
jgi:hypothetical protein